MVHAANPSSEPSPDQLALHQRRRLTGMLREVLASNSFYRKKYAALNLEGDAWDLRDLPFTTRDEIQADQIANPPYGTNLTYPLERYVRLHQTSGSSAAAATGKAPHTAPAPLRWLDTPESWRWFKECWRTMYAAAGVGPNDRLFFPFSFGPFVGFWAAFETAAEMGNFCLPAGGMSTNARLHHLLDNRATVVCCTPTYALRMAEAAAQLGLDLAGSPVRALIVAGEPGGNIPATRQRIESLWGARVFDHSGMTEIGSCSFECMERPGGVHVIETEFIPEVIAPDTGALVSPGECGELVLTNLGRWGSPLIRYRTGDQVRMIRDRCACGRWFAWLQGGILGRCDDMITVRGNNVFPAAIEGIVCGFEEVQEFRIEVDHRRSMTDLRLVVEVAAGADPGGLVERLAVAIRDRFHFRPDVTIAPPGTLPRFEMKSRRVAVFGEPGLSRES